MTASHTSVPATAMGLPGFNSPAVGFEQPFEMLLACHDRVRRSLDLLVRLVDRVALQGHDAATRSAAQDVLRYFTLAAPLHHEDEEHNIFPVLLAQPDPRLHEAVHTLQADHLQMAALWAALQPTLAAWSQLPDASPPSGQVSPAVRQQVDAFTALYASHLVTEEALVYPAARGRMSAQQTIEAGRQMQQRRQASP
jgi:hemerythrin-like domain-containing protein